MHAYSYYQSSRAHDTPSAHHHPPSSAAATLRPSSAPRKAAAAAAAKEAAAAALVREAIAATEAWDEFGEPDVQQLDSWVEELKLDLLTKGLQLHDL
jgi:hypothetical protein